MPEYARSYLHGKTGEYTMNDVLHIAAKHIELENQYASKYSKVFIDTDLINIRVWLLHLYGNCPSWIDEAIANSPSKIHLLCDYDLPWEPDPLRENPHIRKFLFEWYKRELETRNFVYFVVSGKGEARLANAISYLKNLL
jgi:nicotinamide riboside kinase